MQITISAEGVDMLEDAPITKYVDMAIEEYMDGCLRHEGDYNRLTAELVYHNSNAKYSPKYKDKGELALSRQASLNKLTGRLITTIQNLREVVINGNITISTSTEDHLSVSTGISRSLLTGMSATVDKMLTELTLLADYDLSDVTLTTTLYPLAEEGEYSRIILGAIGEDNISVLVRHPVYITDIYKTHIVLVDNGHPVVDMAMDLETATIKEVVDFIYRTNSKETLSTIKDILIDMEEDLIEILTDGGSGGQSDNRIIARAISIVSIVNILLVEYPLLALQHLDKTSSRLNIGKNTHV